MSPLKERMKRMVVFNADKKQKTILQNLTEPSVIYSSFDEIDSKFNEMCESNKMIFHFDQKLPSSSSSSLLKKTLLSKTFKKSEEKSKASLYGSHSVSQATIQTPRNQQEHHKVRFEESSKTNNKINPFNSLRKAKADTSLSTSFQAKLPASRLSLLSGTELKRHTILKERGSQLNIQPSKNINVLSSNSLVGKSIKIIENENESQLGDKLSQAPEWLSILKTLKSKQKQSNPKDKEDSFVNPVVQLFGHTFIAMVLQALVVKKIDDLYGVRINTDSNIPISENLLKQFGISVTMLNSLSNAQEKNKYIADTMTNRISIMIKEWDQKQKQRYDKLNEEIKDQEKEDKKKDAINTDMFEWLNVGNNHEMLKKKLRMAIIEKLTDEENQNEIKLKMKRENQISPRKGFGDTSSRQDVDGTSPRKNQEILSQIKILDATSPRQGEDKTVRLKNITYVSTKVLLLRMDEHENRYLKENLTKEQLEQYQQTFHKDDNKYISQSDQGDQSQYDKEEEEKQLEQKWSPQLEEEFINNKKKAKIIYAEDITVSNWNKQGYVPLFQQFNLKNKNSQMDREELINSYLNGVWLTEKELKFIGDTSKLMNQCIDKQYVQRIVNSINKGDIEVLELELAENIINNYENMERLMRQLRLKFLQIKQNKRIEEKVKNFRYELVAERKKQELESQKRYVRMFKTIGERLLSTKRAYIFDTFKKNFFCKLFFERIKESVQAIRKRKEEERLVDFETHEEKHDKQLANQKHFVDKIAKPTGKLTIGFIKGHELHPPSKIPIYHLREDGKDSIIFQKPTIISFEEIVDKQRSDLMQFMVDRYHLTTRSKPQIRTKENFSKYFSGGPLNESLPFTQAEMLKIKLSAKQYAGIVRIQTLFRQYRMKKIIKALKEQDFATRRYRYRERLLAYMHSTRFIRICQQGTEILKKLIKTRKIYEKKEQTSQSLSEMNNSQGEKDEFKNTPQINKQEYYQYHLKSESTNNQQQSHCKLLTNESNNETQHLTTTGSEFKEISNFKNFDNYESPDPNKTAEDTSFCEDNTTSFLHLEKEQAKQTQEEDKLFTKEKVVVNSEFKQKQSAHQKMTKISEQIPYIPSKMNYRISSSNNKTHNSSDTHRQIGSFLSNNKGESNQIQGKYSITSREDTNKNHPNIIIKTHSHSKIPASSQEMQSLSSSESRINPEKNRRVSTLFSSQKKREPSKKILLKHQKLLFCAKNNDFLKLLDSGFHFNKADLETQDEYGNTPLFYAVDNQNITFVRWLLSLGANLNTPCQEGFTPLHQAFIRDNHNIIHDIMTMVPNLLEQNNEGKIPAEYASHEILMRYDLTIPEIKSPIKLSKEGSRSRAFQKIIVKS